MKRLLTISIAALALFVGTAVAPAKTPVISPQDSCAATLGVEVANACGGPIYRWYYIDSSPPGGYYVGQYGSECGYWQAGWISYSYGSGYRYTAQCRQS